jgi:MFS family permease
VLAFIASFGSVKALSNLLAGRLSDRVGRKQLLVAGWIAGLPVPFIVIFAPSWSWIVFANLLLGVNQGLAWSTTVIMKVDLAGPARRGLALGLNEAAGYLAVALASLASGYIAATWSLRPEPFYLGVVFAVAGLVLSVVFVKDTHGHARHEARLASPASAAPRSFADVLTVTSWRNRSLFAVCQSGLVNNLNDGLAWGLLPLYFAAHGLGVERIAWLAAIYPGVWGLGQLATGALSDRIGRKGLIVGGMLLQGVALFGMLALATFWSWACAAALLGLGTAMVYPTLIATIGDVAAPDWRASAIGVYRLWRDGGYVVGALLAGVLADLFGMAWAIGAVAVLTLASGGVSSVWLTETHRRQFPVSAAVARGAPPS